MRLTTDELLERMQTVLYFDRQWHARCKGSRHFHRAGTPRAAMITALAAFPDAKPRPPAPPTARRRASFD